MDTSVYRSGLAADYFGATEVSFQNIAAESIQQHWRGNGISDQIAEASKLAKEASVWVKVKLASSFQERLEAACPEVAFDLEKKVEFLNAFGGEILNLLEYLIASEDELANLAASSDDDAEAIFVAFAKGLVERLNPMYEIYHDQQHFLQLTDYQKYKDDLKPLEVGDRRSIEAFYVKFETAVNTISRVLEANIPNIFAKGGSLDDLLGRVIQMFQSLASVYAQSEEMLS